MFEIAWQSLYIVLLFISLKRWKTYGKKIILITIVLFYLISIKATYLLLMNPITIDSFDRMKNCQSVVVLGGSGDYDRVLKGLEIAQLNEALVIFSGVHEKYKSIVASFNLENKIFEDKSHNTYENAKNTNEILKNSNIKNICLITSDEHLYRSKKVFESFDINVIPIASSKVSSSFRVSYFLPRIKYYRLNASVVNEYIAIAYYKLLKRI